MHLSKISFLKSFLVVAFVFSLLSFFSFKEVNSELIYNGQFPGVQVSPSTGNPCGELNSEGMTNFDSASMEACEQGGGNSGGGEYYPPEPPEPIIVAPGVSDSVTVYVVPEGENLENTTKGIITAEKDSCIIDDGKNTCDVRFNWSVTNPDPEKVATVKRAPIAGPVINKNSGSEILPVYYWLDSVFNTNRYILFVDKIYTKIVDGVRITENGKILSQSFVKATCKDGSSWAPTLNQCVKNVSVKKFSATNCKIPLGQSSCNSEINWEAIGGYGDFSVTTPTNVTVATGKTGTKSYAVQYPSRDFYFYNNGNELATARSYADCAEGSGWSMTEKKCVSTIVKPNCPTGTTWNETLKTCLCDNGAANPPSCDGKLKCANGALNYPECDTYECPTGTTWNEERADCLCNNGASNPPSCIVKCSNGATNYPTCNSCATGSTFDSASNKCICNNGASNSPECTTCAAGTALNPSTNKCECTNGAANPPACDPNFLKFEVKDCTILDGGNSCQTSLSWSTLATGSFAITTPVSVTVSSALTGSNVPYKVEYPSRSFYAYNNGNELATKTAYAKCAEGSIWNETDNKCVSGLLCAGETERIVETPCPSGQTGHIMRRQTVSYPSCEFPEPATEANSIYVSDNCRPADRNCGPETCEYDLCEGDPSQQVSCSQVCGGEVVTRVTFCPPAVVNPLNIDFRASADRILVGKPVTLTWSSDADTCNATSGNFITGTLANGSYGSSGNLKPRENTTFTITCEKGEISDSKEVTVKVNTISIIEN